MEVGNSRGAYLFCMLKLLINDNESFKVDRIYGILEHLKESAEMMWLKEATIAQFQREWNHETEIEVVAWLSCLRDQDPITPVDVMVGLLPNFTVELYDDQLCIGYNTGKEIAYFVYALIGHYGLLFQYLHCVL